MTILRLLLAPVLGIVVLIATVSGVQSIGHRSYPMPAVIGELGDAFGKAVLAGDQEEMARLNEEISAETAKYLETAPTGALLFVVFAWIAGAFLGGGIAAAVAPFLRIPMALAIGLADAAGIVLTTSMLPHPLWMPILGIGGAIVASLLAGFIVPRASSRPAKGTD